eukprot:1991187-Prymnesium_polylepis.1
MSRHQSVVEGVVEEVECGAAGDRLRARYARPCVTSPRDAAPAAAPAHSMPQYWVRYEQHGTSLGAPSRALRTC